jgi:hypothetical protein
MAIHRNSRDSVAQTDAIAHDPNDLLRNHNSKTDARKSVTALFRPGPETANGVCTPFDINSLGGFAHARPSGNRIRAARQETVHHFVEMPDVGSNAADRVRWPLFRRQNFRNLIFARYRRRVMIIGDCSNSAAESQQAVRCGLGAVTVSFHNLNCCTKNI